MDEGFDLNIAIESTRIVRGVPEPPRQLLKTPVEVMRTDHVRTSVHSSHWLRPHLHAAESRLHPYPGRFEKDFRSLALGLSA